MDCCFAAAPCAAARFSHVLKGEGEGPRPSKDARSWHVPHVPCPSGIQPWRGPAPQKKKKKNNKNKNARASAYVEERGLLSRFQAGFRPRHGTHDHLLTLNEVATACWERRRPLYMAFLVVAKAHDRVWRDALWYRMNRVGITGKALRVFRSSYSSVRRAVIVNDRVTPEFECRSGVAQGARFAHSVRRVHR